MPDANATVTSLRILVAEDEAMLGLLYTDMLEAMGHTVCAVATTEAEAVAAAALHNPDLLIADARLGKGSGVAAVDQILRAGRMPHLFITGAFAKLNRLGLEAVVLEKPFDEADLQRAIQRALDLAVVS